MRPPWLKPKILICLYPKIGWSLIFWHASSPWSFIGIIIEVSYPAPIGMHSTCLLNSLRCFISRVTTSCSQSCFRPLKTTRGAVSFWNGPSLGFDGNSFGPMNPRTSFVSLFLLVLGWELKILLFLKFSGPLKRLSEGSVKSDSYWHPTIIKKVMAIFQTSFIRFKILKL